ncbi:hypothetical protein ACJJTC_008440 [Scirpophaga incertulas]
MDLYLMHNNSDDQWVDDLKAHDSVVRIEESCEEGSCCPKGIDKELSFINTLDLLPFDLRSLCLGLFSPLIENPRDFTSLSETRELLSEEYDATEAKHSSLAPMSHVDISGGIPPPENSAITHQTSEYLIDTPGCQIPNYAKTLNFEETPNQGLSCGHRAVFIEKVSPESILFRIDWNKLKKYYNINVENVSCCYRTVSRSDVTSKEDSDIKYSKCMSFKNGTVTPLINEVITVKCYKQEIIYEDAYIILKKVRRKITNTNKKNSWNVLLLGMDTMSRGRAISSMPKTVAYFKRHKWLDFRGYQKVAFNTFPNLMALLTGKNMSTIYRTCQPNMDNCRNMMLWNKFHKAGYVTAYGEDFLHLPDTFSHYGFKVPPTDHYMRPYFLTGERNTGNFDHGIRYGKLRFTLESYYEERLPMLFVWVPLMFRKQYENQYQNLQLNQNRLTSHLDLHMTLWEILRITNQTISVETSESCPTCKSLFEKVSYNRKCEEAGVNEKWCTCHKMQNVALDNAGKRESLQLAISEIQNRTKKITTVPCAKCSSLTLKSVLRTHFYKDSGSNRTFYVIAFVMSPGNVAFETKVMKDANSFEIVESTETISEYNTRGNCVKNRNDRPYCVCEKLPNCFKHNR